jgi:class 3 adenylate cyclase
MLAEQISWGVLGLQGPFVSAQGDWTMLTSLPVFTPSDSQVDYGNVTSNGNCSIPQCFANGTHYWGTVYAILLIKPLVASLTSLDSIRQQGWRLSVTRETVSELTPEQMFAFNFAYNKTLFQVNGEPINPVSVQAKLIKSYSPAETSLMLQLSLSPANGWGGNWWVGAVAAVVLASVLVSALTFISLVSRAQEEFLLYSILPPKVVSVMRSGESFVAQNECTLVFADVCGFTSISSTWTPHEVAAFVSELSFLFERECRLNGLCKIDLIGDCLFAGHGILETEDPVSGAVSAVKCALGLLHGVEGIVTKDGTPVRLRIGIHSGECVTTVVGQEFPKLTVFVSFARALCTSSAQPLTSHPLPFVAKGDHVNIASRMESTGRPMEVHISTVIANRLREAGLKENGLALECRGKVELKNRGEMETYWAREASDPSLRCPRDGPSRSYAKKSGSLSLQEESINSDGLQHVGIEITEKGPAKENDRRSGRISATLPHTFNTGDHSKTSNSYWTRSSLTSRNQPVLRLIVSEDDPAPEGLSRVFSQASPHSLPPSDFDKRQKSMPVASPVMRIG